MIKLINIQEVIKVKLILLAGLNDMVFAADATRTQLDITRRMYADCPSSIWWCNRCMGTKNQNKTYYKKFYVPLRFFFNNSWHNHCLCVH